MNDNRQPARGMGVVKRSIRFEELGPQRSFASRELQARADQNPWARDRRQYLVWLDNDEVAYVSFDDFWEEELNLYEIFVAKEHRGHGIGGEILRFAADLGKSIGKKRLSVRASPLSDQNEAELISWYRRHGLTASANDPAFLLMDLT